MNTEQLEFVVFCIENVADKLQKNPKDIYAFFSKDSDMLSCYIVPNYDVLHTQSKEYIVEDLIEVMKLKGYKE